MGRMRTVGERQRDDRKPFADRFDKNTWRQCVAYSVTPFINGVQGCRGDNDGVWRGQDIWSTRFLVLAPHGMTRQLLQRGGINESRCRRSLQQADVQSGILGEADETCELPCGRRSSRND